MRPWLLSIAAKRLVGKDHARMGCEKSRLVSRRDFLDWSAAGTGFFDRMTGSEGFKPNPDQDALGL